jgi:hypothetical protein
MGGSGVVIGFSELGGLPSCGRSGAFHAKGERSELIQYVIIPPKSGGL